MAAAGRSGADDVLITLLASGTTRQAAAARAKVSERTLYRRLQDVTFRARIDEARADMVARASAMLTAAGMAAAETLIRLLRAESDAVKLSAASRILELGGRLRTDLELEARLAALEAQLEADPRPIGGKAWGA